MSYALTKFGVQLYYSLKKVGRAGAKEMESKISLRVSDEDLEIIDSFIARHDFKNRSEFIREAALEYISRHNIRSGETEVPGRIHLPKRFKHSIHYLISLDYFNSWEHALQELVKMGLMTIDASEIETKLRLYGEIGGKVEGILEVHREKDREYLQR